MKLAILCLCLASTASAAPFLHYLPHFGGPRQGPPTQVNNGAYMPQTSPGMAPISMEIVFPRRFGGGPSIPGQSFPSQAFIKYSIPQAPGRQSVEIYYPYDFNKHQIIPNLPPMPQLPNIFPFEYPQQTVPQQTPNVATFADANPPQSQAPLQPVPQDQPVQASQAPANQ